MAFGDRSKTFEPRRRAGGMPSVDQGFGAEVGIAAGDAGAALITAATLPPTRESAATRSRSTWSMIGDLTRAQAVCDALGSAIKACNRSDAGRSGRPATTRVASRIATQFVTLGDGCGDTDTRLSRWAASSNSSACATPVSLLSRPDNILGQLTVRSSGRYLAYATCGDRTIVVFTDHQVPVGERGHLR